MKSAELVDYISGALRDGKSFRSITFELVNAGWDHSDVQDAMDVVQKLPSSSHENMTRDKEGKKPLPSLVGIVSNPLPSFAPEMNKLTLQKKRTQGAIPVSRVFTSFLKKEMEGEHIPEDQSKPLSDVPLVEIMSPLTQESPASPEKELVSKTQEEELRVPVPPKDASLQPEKYSYQSPTLRPDGYFIPTLRYLADETMLGTQTVQKIADQIGRPSFVVPTKVNITMWRREESPQS